MAKKQEQPKPLFPLKHDFIKSLDTYIHQAGMLSDAVCTLIQMDQIPDKVKDIIKERLAAFDAAAGYDENNE